LTNASLDYIAKIDLFNKSGIDIPLLEGALEGNSTKLGTREGFQGAIERCDGCANGRDYNDFRNLRLSGSSTTGPQGYVNDKPSCGSNKNERYELQLIYA